MLSEWKSLEELLLDLIISPRLNSIGQSLPRQSQIDSNFVMTSH